MESEDGSGEELSDPYPYEGKYKDEEDKQESVLHFSSLVELC